MGMTTKHKSELKLKVAQNFEAAGDNLHALQLYHSLINEDPGFVEAYFSLAELFEKQGNFTSAKNLLTGFINENPDSSLARLFLAQLLLRNSQWEDVVEVLHNILVEEEPLAAFFSGYSYFMMKDYEPAKISLLNFIAYGKKTELIHEAYIYLAKIEIQLKHFKSALEYAKEAGTVYSNYWELNLIYAIIYYHLGMYNHAVKLVEKAIQLNPGNSSSYEWAGKIYLKSEDYIKAENNFLKHIRNTEYPSSDIYSGLAEACLKSNKVKDAVMYYEMALKIDPKNILAAEGKEKASFILKSGTADV
jgi:tetratricopeptide (TPR) repeat protein